MKSGKEKCKNKKRKIQKLRISENKSIIKNMEEEVC
jgi:hypothetical protein